MSVSLADILPLLQTKEVWGNTETVIDGISHDSRRIASNFAFVAISGEKVDGHDFILKAAFNGASVIIAEKKPPRTFDSRIAWVRVQNSRRNLGPVAALIYGKPSNSMALVGITGTNGKTTTSFLLESIFKAANLVPGVIGTITHRWPGSQIAALNTTPEASDIQKILSDMKQAGVTHVVMEVSSHGLVMRRLDGCNFDMGIFSNLTHDHLDFHQDMETYFAAKKILFEELLPTSSKCYKCAAINVDDPYGYRLASEIHDLPKIKYGFSDEADIQPIRTNISQRGITATVKTPKDIFEIESELVGEFNLSNILAALSVSLRLQIPKEAILAGIKSVRTVPGRLERVNINSGSIFVDYAHTPNALKNVLQAMRKICKGVLITVMGCGGDRDKTKRPVMGMEAACGSDFVVITSDNPRNEKPINIINQIEAGVVGFGFTKVSDNPENAKIQKGSYIVIPDRREAIRWAISRLGAQDVLLLAGKGHETYQEINGVRHPFNDRVIALEVSRNHFCGTN